MLHKASESINISGEKKIDYPLAPHTTYRVGGSADIYFQPQSDSDLSAIILWTREAQLPIFVLGGGSNILVSDNGIRGAVIDMTELCQFTITDSHCTFGAGIAIQDAALIMARNHLGGMHHFYGMPGTLGGAVWMNARCYGVSIAELLVEALFYNEKGEAERMSIDNADFGYKTSPFQARHTIIHTITIEGKKAPLRLLQREMFTHLSDRYHKGHYDAPSAGSVFKNNRAFGKPSGVIIDSLGLRGYRVGGAMVSKRHANIFVNAGDATAEDFRILIEEVRHKVAHAYNIYLEEEVQYVGDWP